MKKIAIVLFVVATALAACGKKKDPATPATTTGSGDMGSAAPMGGSGDAPAGGGSAAM
jgi:hypothetical protein